MQRSRPGSLQLEIQRGQALYRSFGINPLSLRQRWAERTYHADETPFGKHWIFQDVHSGGPVLEGTPIDPDRVIEFDWQDCRLGRVQELEYAIGSFLNGA
jgi:hypothetical protein